MSIRNRPVENCGRSLFTFRGRSPLSRWRSGRELWRSCGAAGSSGGDCAARYGLVAGVVLTSAFFGLMHMDPAQLLVLACMGAYLHFAYLASRSIWVSMVLHATNNGIAVLLAAALPPEQVDRPTPLILPLVACALVVVGSIALWTSRARLERLPGEAGMSGWKPEYPGISAPPPEANARLGHGAINRVALIFTILCFCAMMYLGYRYVI